MLGAAIHSGTDHGKLPYLQSMPSPHHWKERMGSPIQGRARLSHFSCCHCKYEISVACILLYRCRSDSDRSFSTKGFLFTIFVHLHGTPTSLYDTDGAASSSTVVLNLDDNLFSCVDCLLCLRCFFYRVDSLSTQ